MSEPTLYQYLAKLSADSGLPASGVGYRPARRYDYTNFLANLSGTKRG